MKSENGNPAGLAPLEWFTPWRFGLLLTLLLIAAFPSVLLGSHSFFLRDYGVLGYPFVYFHHQSFWNGELPLWNPLSNCGAPFLAQWGTMTLYPFSIIYLALPLPWSLSLFCFAHLLLAGMGMYFLARRWTGNNFAASVAGVAYVFNGVMFSSLIWPNYLVALGWMPFAVLLAERAWREGGRLIVLAALVAALQMLSGAPEIVLLTWILIGALWLLELVRSGAPRGAMSWRMAVVVLLTAGLMAAQLLPFFDLLAASQRDKSFATAKWAMPLGGWANLLVPLFHCYRTPQGQFFQYGQQFMTSYYPGAGLLALAVWGVLVQASGRGRVLGALLLFSLIMAMGEQTFIYAGFRKIFPLLGLARYPVKFMTLAAFIIPLLAAFAVNSYCESSREKRVWRPALLIGVTTLGAMAAVLWFAHGHRFQFDDWSATFENAVWQAGGLVLILVLLPVVISGKRLLQNSDVCVRVVLAVVMFATIAGAIRFHSPNQNPVLPAALFRPNFLMQEAGIAPPNFGQGRVMISPQAENALLNSRVAEEQANWIGKRLALWSNLNLLDDAPKVNGSSTLQVREQKQIETLLYAVTNGLPAGLMDFLGVSQVTASNSVIDWTPRQTQLPLLTGGQKPVFADGTNVFQALLSADFKPREIVYLPEAARDFISVTGATHLDIITNHISAQRLEAEVDAAQSGLLVIAQSFYPAWEATVDGRPVALWRANHAFQALEVPSGRHTVRIVYHDWNFKAGAGLSLATLLGCGLYWMRSRRLEKR